MAKSVFIAGEDPVTREILQRLIQNYCPNLVIAGTLPARGSELKSKVQNFNALAADIPVIVLSDLDTEDCAPLAKSKLLNGVVTVAENLIINIAVDEAEAWLLADRDGFANYFKIDITNMPTAKEQKFGGPRKRLEVDVPLKASLYLTHQLMAYSKDPKLKAQIYTNSKSKCKGSAYNTAMLPFIKSKWNVEQAARGSYSLQTTIDRLKALDDRS